MMPSWRALFALFENRRLHLTPYDSQDYQQQSRRRWACFWPHAGDIGRVEPRRGVAA